MAASATDQLEVVSNVYNYVINNVTYDTAKASSVQSGYLPNVDVVLAQKKGICFDYAALYSHAQIPGHSYQAGSGLYGESVSRMD